METLDGNSTLFLNESTTSTFQEASTIFDVEFNDVHDAEGQEGKKDEGKVHIHSCDLYLNFVNNHAFTI